MNELTSLSATLNQHSDELNTLISSINDQLAKLNLGIETWLDSTLLCSGSGPRTNGQYAQATTTIRLPSASSVNSGSLQT